MFTPITKLAAKRGKLARLALAGVVLFGAAPMVIAETTSIVTTTTASPVDGTWKMTVVPDAAARAAGRDQFDEYVTIDGFGYTGMEICRLGFNPATPTTGLNAAGCITFTAVMSSKDHGTVTSTGSFNLLNTQMSGSLKWVKDGVTYNYTYTGARYTPAASDYES